MKLEFLNDISNGEEFKDVVSEKLVRLYDFDQSEAIAFRDLLSKRILIINEELDLSTVDFIKTVNCNLTFRLSNENIGLRTNDNYLFTCDLTTSEYENMIDLLEPFCIKGRSGYQWLYESEDEIDLLFSFNGKW